MPSTRRRGVKADLALNGAVLGELKGSDVASEVEAVGARRGEEVLAGVGEGADVGAVLGPAVGDARGDEGEVAVGVDGEMGCWVDAVFAKAIAFFHEDVEVMAGRVDGKPAGVVVGVGASDGSDEVEIGCEA